MRNSQLLEVVGRGSETQLKFLDPEVSVSSRLIHKHIIFRIDNYTFLYFYTFFQTLDQIYFT